MAYKESLAASLPKRIFKHVYCWLEPLSILLLITLTCFFYIYDVFYVVPQIFGFCGQAINFPFSTWIVYNILGNLWACCRTSSSVRSLRPELMQPVKGEEYLWRYCDKCDKLMPPRVWHCKLCNCCILKRDHHCTFTGNCIGHNNQRYFIALTFHLTVGAGLALIYNFIMAVRHGFNKGNWWPYDFLFAEEAFVVDKAEILFSYLMRTIFYINLLCFLLPLLVFIWQILLVRNNAVSADSLDRTYDLGIGRNFTQVLGNRRFCALLSPTMESSLPHDGTHWQSKRTA